VSAFADLVRFLPVAGGTTDWVVSSAVGGCQLPSAANVLNGVSYKLYAVSTDLTQWEVVISVYNSGTTTFPRTTVLYNSSGTGTATGQSGAGTKINFSTIPQVSVVAIAEDMVPQQQGHLPGEPSTGSAAAGEVGEFISATATTSTLVSTTQTNITSITLSAGDWDITAGYSGIGSSTPIVTVINVSINTVTATIVNTAGQSFGLRGTSLTDPILNGNIGPLRVSISGSTSYFLNTQATYTGAGATFAVTGIIRARRAR
jgi:hypothetical protein